MFFKRLIVSFLARKTKKAVDAWSKKSIKNQDKIFKKFIATLAKTKYGKDIGAHKKMCLVDFQKKSPINSYEDLSPYIKRISRGEKNVLWMGRPAYFAKTSGTTSGVKFIPLTIEMLKNQINSSKEALLLYAFYQNKFDAINGKMMFIQGSPILKKHGQIKTGRLSGIVANHVPFFLQPNRLPSFETNSIGNWDKKLEGIINETVDCDLRLIGGIPPWVIMYFQKILKKTHKENVNTIFPNLSLYVHGGVNFKPYKNTLKSMVPNANFLELYPASEGFFAYQDDINDDGLLLLTNHGVFYEFIESDNFLQGVFQRITLKDVVLGKNYVLIISTCSGLWSYNIGDTVMFVNLNPYKIIITGRIKHYISAFGEHVISKEVETALDMCLMKFGGEVFSFTVCPNINPENGLPHHDWFIEFIKKPANFSSFCEYLDTSLRKQNIYYNDLVKNNIIRPLVVNCVKVGSFNNYMKSIGKLGGQNKCPLLSNDRKIGDFLSNYLI
tara:strand:- start:482 stop:1975 length:1494 start_codon:yes stop_codon:yes gene_type:complete